MLNKTLCSIRALVPVSLSLSLSLSLWLTLWSAETRCAHTPAQAPKTLSGRHPVPSPPSRGRQVPLWATQALSQSTLLVFCINKEYEPLSLFYFLIVDSGPPGSSPLECYAQVAKSPSDHQGADIPCKNKRVFITKLELGLPPDTDTAAIGRSPGFCVTLLI